MRRRGLLLLAVVSCTPVLPPAQASPSRGYTGEVGCLDGRHRESVIDSVTAARYGIAAAEVARHEMMHVAQLFVACDSTLALWHRDTLARAVAEVQATCVGIEVYPDSATRQRRRDRSLLTLSLLYGSAVRFSSLYTAFERWCR